MKAIVTGMIASYPVGGVAWDYGQYLIGLEQLGFEVFYLEDTGWQTYDPVAGDYGTDPSYGVGFLQNTLAELSPNLGSRWSFRSMDGALFGMGSDRLQTVLREADLFLNVSGGTLLREEYAQCERKVLIDTDPGWNHFRNFPKWDANPGWQGALGYRAHDFFFTYAERIGTQGCSLPTLNLKWLPTRPVVALDRWQKKAPGRKWTTVMTWKNFQETIKHEGVTYGTKEMEFDKIESLPKRVDANLELAVGGSGAPVERWREIGWSVVNSQAVSKDAGVYRNYIETSRGEISIAKNVYVATGSGWFSCRSVCYLAAGLPVVVQDTGFSDFLPSGAGLFCFKTMEEAVAAIEQSEARYSYHCEAARAIAAAHFDAPVVLENLLRRIGL